VGLPSVPLALLVFAISGVSHAQPSAAPSPPPAAPPPAAPPVAAPPVAAAPVAAPRQKPRSTAAFPSGPSVTPASAAAPSAAPGAVSAAGTATVLSTGAQGVVVPLWEKGAPGFENRRLEPEVAKDWWVRNIHNPSLTVFLPPAELSTGAAVVVAPGGGYRELVFNPEGKEAAEYLNRLGVAAFVLKYRLPNEAGSPYTMDHVRQDAWRALRLARSRAREWHFDPHRLGMLGFSAGGDLVGQIAYQPGQGNAEAPDPIDRENGRPDFQILIYPGGKVPDTIRGDAPPAFLLVADDDEYGCDQTTLELFTKLHAAKVPVEAHFLARGKHAFNMGNRSSYTSVRDWPKRMADWLADSGYLSRSDATSPVASSAVSGKAVPPAKAAPPSPPAVPTPPAAARPNPTPAR
jgi:acetyl esterase/lipase